MSQSDRRNRASSATRSGTQVVRGRYGSMQIHNARSPFRVDAGLSVFEQECRWQADRRLFPELAAFVVPFRLLSASNGERRLLPANEMHGYSPFATRLGFEILSSEPAMSADHRGDYELMLKLNQRMLTTQAHLKRQFSSLTDLIIRRRGRLDQQNDKNVLPADLGMRADGRGRKWSIERLIEEGNSSLEKALRSIPSEQRSEYRRRMRIPHGIMAAAELSPLRLDGTKLLQIIRMAVLELSNDRPRNARQMKTWVLARLRALWNAHLNDSAEKFRSWFQGGRSNLVKSLANLHGYPGGRLERDHVDWALLEFTAQGLWYAANCQQRFALAVWETISPPFEGMNRSIFEQWYLPQRYLGGLSLPLLWERSTFLRPILGRVWTNPTDRQLHAVLWRILDFYSQMVSARRPADCLTKFRSRRPTTRQFIEPAQEQTQSVAEQLEEWLEILAVTSSQRCRNERCKIQYASKYSGEQTVVINRFCSQHGALPPVCLSMQKVREIVRKESES